MGMIKEKALAVPARLGLRMLVAILRLAIIGYK